MDDMTYEIDETFKLTTVREELLEALLRECLDWLFMWRDMMANISEDRLIQRQNETITRIQRALAPDADHAALLKEVQGDE